MLSPPSHDLYLDLWFLLSMSCTFQHKLYTYFVRFIPKYFMFLRAVVNGIFFYMVVFLKIFSCFIALAKASISVLSRSGESNHSCLVFYLKGKAFGFLPSSVMQGVGFYRFASFLFFCRYPFSTWGSFFLLLACWEFLMLSLVTFFLYIYWDDHVFYLL